MKKIILLSLVLCSFTVFCQDTVKVIGFKSMKILKPDAGYGQDSALCYLVKNANVNGIAGFIAIVGTDSMFLTISDDSIRLYGNKPVSINGHPVLDTTSLSNRIDLKADSTDNATRTWVSNQDYLIGNDTTNLSDSLRSAWITKLQLSDSAGNFITPYDTVGMSVWISAFLARLDSGKVSTLTDTIWESLTIIDELKVLSHITSPDFSFWDGSIINGVIKSRAASSIEYWLQDTAGTLALLYNAKIGADTIQANLVQFINMVANTISSATALDFTTASGNSIMSVDSTQTQFYENVFFEKTISTDNSLIITDASGADSTVFRDDGTNFRIDNDNQIKISIIPETSTADSIVVVEDGILKKQKGVSITADTFQTFHVDSLYVNDYLYMNGSQVIYGTYTLLDGGSIVLPAGTSGMMKCMIGNNLAGVEFSYATDGTFRYSDSWGAVFFTDSGTGLRVYDSGTSVTIKYVGSAEELKIQGNL